MRSASHRVVVVYNCKGEGGGGDDDDDGGNDECDERQARLAYRCRQDGATGAVVGERVLDGSEEAAQPLPALLDGGALPCSG